MFILDSLFLGNVVGYECKVNEELYDVWRWFFLMVDLVEVEDYYDGLLFRKNSFGKKGILWREIFGCWDIFNCKEDIS